MSVIVQCKIPVNVNCLDKAGSWFLSQIRKFIRQTRETRMDLKNYRLEDIGFTPRRGEIVVNLYFYPVLPQQQEFSAPAGINEK